MERPLVSILKRHISPDFHVGRWIQILKILNIFLRFESTCRLELRRNLPFQDRHWELRLWERSMTAKKRLVTDRRVRTDDLLEVC